MTSKEIADLVESRHDDVKRSIERLSSDLCNSDGTIKRPAVISQPPLADGNKSANGVVEKVYLINKRDSYIIVAQLSPEFTARLVDRWQELEAQQLPALPNYQEALRQLADSLDKQSQLEQVIEAQKPAVQFLSNYVEAKASKCLSDVAKILRHKPQAFIAMLADDGVLFNRSGNWIPYQQHIDNGRFTVHTGEAHGHAFSQCRVEPAGIAWLATKYGNAA